MNPIVTSGRSWWRQWWLITGVSVVLIVGAAALIASTGGDDDGDEAPSTRATPTETEATEAPSATAAPATEASPDTGPITAPITDAPAAPPSDTAAPATDAPASSAGAPDDTSPDDAEVDGAPAGSRGDRASPVPAGEIADIGDGWRLQVLGVIDDGTDLVLAENQFNEPPRPGTKFTLVDVALGYYGRDDPSSAFIPTISGVASASVQLDEQCGVIPDELRVFADVFAGGVVRGRLCYVTIPSDDGTVQLYATTSFDGPDVFLAAVPPPAGLAIMPTLTGPQPGAAATPSRLAPTPLGTPVDVGEGWTLTVTSPAADITDAVAAENQFNEPPPEGFRFVGVGVEFGYAGEGAGSPFEVTTAVVGDSNLQAVEGCGVIPDAVDVFGDVFAGGTVAGNLCFVTPVDDIGTLVLYAATGFDGGVEFFATQ